MGDARAKLAAVVVMGVSGAGKSTVGKLIAARLKARTGHFMPPELLRSQFEALQEPGADERAVTVSIDATPEKIADEVIRRL